MKKKFLFCFLIIIFALLFFNYKTYAADDLDRITNFEVKIDPRMNDGSLDITYNITWKVLDSTTEGPLTWVKIGTPNENFTDPKALSNTIKSISKYSGSYVKIDFTRAYKAGEEVNFKYSIHQPYMYKLGWFGKVKYKFTPAWFSDAKVDNLTVLWNADQVKKDDSKKKEDNYLIWNKTKISKGGKMTVNVTYDKSAFGYLDSNKQRNKASNLEYGSSRDYTWVIYVIVFIVSIVLSVFGGGGGYYDHRGFYGGGYYGGFHGGCAHSSCACAHSSCASSCACACAGSGRAGCSLKDFYGTNITSKKIEKAFK